MDLEESQFIKNRENDVLNRGTKGENVTLLIVRIGMIVGTYCLLYRLITVPEDPEYWYDAFVVFVLGHSAFKMTFWGEMAERKKCIKKGQKFAAKLIDVEARKCMDRDGCYTDYISQFQCLENSEEYVIHFDNFDIRKYIANPYCNLYLKLPTPNQGIMPV